MKILFLIMSLLLSAQVHARILQGDWESYGNDAIEPYLPAYPIKYDCQVEISDSVDRTEKNSSFKMYAIAKFSFTNEKTSFYAEDLQWNWLKANEGHEETVLEKSKKFFSLKKHFFHMTFLRGTEPKTDQVVIGSELLLPLSSFMAPHSTDNTFAREATTLINRNEVYAYAKGEKNNPYLKSYLQCEKIK